nr:MAG TPA: Pectate lyase [Caudoviricetes sp.]
MSDEFKKVNKFCFWSQKVLPLVYDDSLSYMEVLCKVTKLLNELIKNNNELPDYIGDLIEKYITSGALEKVVQNVVSNFILNVKYPPNGITPATGDGSGDDTESLQGCIDYAYNQGGGVVYIPYGKYLVNSLTMRDGVSLIGFNRYSTILVLKGGATNSLIDGTNVSDFSVMNLTVDGNASNQVNDLTLIKLSGSNYLLSNLICLDSNQLMDIDASGHLQIENIIFNKCGTNALSIRGDNIAQMRGVIFNDLSKVSGVNVLSIASNNGEYAFTSTAVCENCCVITGNNNMVGSKILNAINPITDNGNNNSVSNYGVSEKICLAGLKETKALKDVNNSTDIVFNSENPLTYKEPVAGWYGFKTIPFKDYNGNSYNVLVEGDTNNIVTIVDNVEELKNVGVACTVITKGFYTANDGGGGVYEVSNTDIATDNYTVFECKNSLKAVLRIDNNTTFLTVGGKGDGTGESDRINSYLKIAVNSNVKAIFPSTKTYGMDKDIFIPDGCYIVIDGEMKDIADIAIYNKDNYSDVRPEYTGNGNIVICGRGVINANADGFTDHGSTTIRLMHGHDIEVSGITLKNFGGYHGIEVIGCNNVKIDDVNFMNHIMSPSSSSHSTFESVIQIEAAAGEIGQSGAYPYDNTPVKNLTISNCVFNGKTGKHINSGIESQAQSLTDETYYHENIKIYNNKFYNVVNHCIIPYRWTGCDISGNYCYTTGKAFIGNISGNLGFSVSESIITSNIIYDTCNNETEEGSDTFAINIHASSHVNITHNAINGCKTGVLALFGVCNKCQFSNNNATYVSKLGSNMFYVENVETTCDIIGNSMSTDDATVNAGLASLPPNNDTFKGAFLCNRIEGVIFQYRDNKLIGNGDTIYTGTSFVAEITPVELCNKYSSIKVVFKLNAHQWEKEYRLNDDSVSVESVVLYDSSTTVLLINYKIVIDTNTGHVFIQNTAQKTLTISPTGSNISSSDFTSYVSKIYGIKGNIRN